MNRYDQGSKLTTQRTVPSQLGNINEECLTVVYILSVEICLQKLDLKNRSCKNELMPSNSGVVDGL